VAISYNAYFTASNFSQETALYQTKKLACCSGSLLL